MKDKLDNILLSLLWLLASALGTCFWFNIRFGFNIFSSAHWRHLAYMQANQTPITPAFYISIVTSILIILIGLYILLRPQYRRITLPIRDKKPTQTSSQQQTVTPNNQPDPTINMVRPARLNVSPAPIATTTAPTAPIQTPQQTSPVQNTSHFAPPTPSNDWPQLREIFETAGYTIKKAPKINSTQTALLAIGSQETLWIGAVGIDTATMQRATDTMTQIFSDTLEDIYININAFVLSAPDASAPSAPDILTFDSMETLRKYINEHKNTPPDDTDQENFEAFSSYISTVVEYLGKI